MFESLVEPWLVKYHINKYVRKTDFRYFNKGAPESSGFKRMINKERMAEKRLASLRKVFKGIDVD